MRVQRKHRCECNTARYEDGEWCHAGVAHGYHYCPWCGCYLDPAGTAFFMIRRESVEKAIKNTLGSTRGDGQ